MSDDITFVDDPDQKGSLVPKALFVFGVILVVILAIFGNISDDVNTQLVLVWASVICIGVSIVWSVRKKIFSYVLAFIMLFCLYYIEGLILYGVGIIDEPFSVGIMTLIIIMVFVAWVSTDSKITWDDIGKVVFFCILIYFANSSGWLEGTNEIIYTALTGGGSIINSGV